MVHEMVIAQQILEVALEEARRHRGRCITALHLRLGDLEGVESEVMREAFAIVAQGTIAEEAELAIERIPSRLACEECGEEAMVEELVHGGAIMERCRKCSGPYRILQGKGWTLETVRVST